MGLVELLILYARVQFYMHRALDYRLISQTVFSEKYKFWYLLNILSFS
jgi:hypothetical protein